jgi:hypothetical protein
MENRELKFDATTGEPIEGLPERGPPTEPVPNSRIFRDAEGEPIHIHSCYVKPSYNNDKFASDETTINIPEGIRNKTRRGNSTSGAFIHNDITGRCKDISNN